MPNREVVPSAGLMGTNLPQRTGGGIAVEANPSYKTGLKRQIPINLTGRFQLSCQSVDVDTAQQALIGT